MFKLDFKSYTNKINKEIDKFAKEKVSKAAKFVKDNLKNDVASKFGRRSNISKGVGLKKLRDGSALVGFGSPGYSAHLLEFGTDQRYTKKGSPTGHIKAKPFFTPSFERSSPGVEQILKERWF